MNRLHRAPVPVLAASLALLLAAPVIAATPSTTLVSVSSSGEQQNAYTFPNSQPSISADGRFVAFVSLASNLAPGDTNRRDDVFVRDLRNRTTERVSVSSEGKRANGFSEHPSISADGRFVAFASAATNLVAHDTNGTKDVFVRDRRKGATELVSVSSAGRRGNRTSWSPSISADGRFVAFASSATDFVAGDTNGQADVFVHDRRSGRTRRVSVSSSWRQGNRRSGEPSISADGRFIAFSSAATNLVPGDTNAWGDVFVRDRRNGTTTRVSVSSTGKQGDHWSSHASISADGRFVVFVSKARTLLHPRAGGIDTVFVHDRRNGTTALVSASLTGAMTGSKSLHPSISADGRFIAFECPAGNLVAGDTNEDWDVFVRDRKLGTTTRVSVSSSGEQGILWSRSSSISADGRFVAFWSESSNLVVGDTNDRPDVFIRGPLR
jgi:Tol biopolymer transport system component